MHTEPDPELLRLLPCLKCQHPSAQPARDEIAQVYISARNGATSLLKATTAIFARSGVADGVRPSSSTPR